jgi:hypothetical protein
MVKADLHLHSGSEVFTNLLTNLATSITLQVSIQFCMV